MQALDTLTKNDISEVKIMKSPPPAVRLVMEAVCILKDLKPIKIKDPSTGRWVPAKLSSGLQTCLVCCACVHPQRRLKPIKIEGTSTGRVRLIVDAQQCGR